VSGPRQPGVGEGVRRVPFDDRAADQRGVRRREGVGGVPAGVGGAPAGEVGDATLVDLIDRLLTGGVVLAGDVTLSLAGVDLVHVSIRALVSAVETLESGGQRR
jgi:Gas vesicle protein